VLLKTQLWVVLHQVQSPENLGAVARAMANFGMSQLVLSDPRIADPEGARRVAVHSEQVLSQALTVPSLREALRPATYVCGTSFRSQVEARSALSPEEAVTRLVAHAAQGPVALVLGGERRGLSDEELGECDAFLTIPTDSVQPSMNLAQAATVLLYLLSRAERPAPEPEPMTPPARQETVQALEASMRSALTAAGFLNPQAPDYALRELLHSLRRGRPSQREVELWTAAFKQLGRPR
jgi:tRNA/rRNA methyltransferase